MAAGASSSESASLILQEIVMRATRKPLARILLWWVASLLGAGCSGENSNAPKPPAELIPTVNVHGTLFELYEDSEVYVADSEDGSRLQTVSVNDRINVEGSFRLQRHETGDEIPVTVKFVMRYGDGEIVANSRNARAQRNVDGRYAFACELNGPQTPGEYAVQVTVDHGILNESPLRVE